MTKLNNKGVSLIDCLIAIAVLALLVSPIIAQLFTTIQVSAEAKEKQYVIDDATDVYEYFRKYDKKELTDAISNESNYKINNISSGTKECTLYLNNGNKVTAFKDKRQGHTGNTQTVTYNYVKYELDDSNQMGRENNQYSRYVVWTDLKNKLYENGFQVDYSISAGSTLDSSLSGFTLRSDNSIVKTSSTSDIYDDSAIECIVVKDRKEGTDPIDNTYVEEYMNDPNGIDIGNVQDIDSEKMAIISGDATAIDYQLDLSLQNVLVQYATANPTSAIGTYADDPERLNNYIKSIINNSSSTSKVRKIKVYVECGKNSSGGLDLDSNGKPKFYTVKCEVTYRVTFSGSDLKAFDNFTSTTGEFTYPVLERNYYTNTPPDIYMVYEPLLLSTSMNSYVLYADNDYISIYTDEYTSGVYDNGTAADKSDDTTRVGDDPTRLYLIRSIQNWSKVAATQGAMIPTEADVRNFDEYAYYTYRYGKFVPVNIFINMETKTGSTGVPIDIYTNISKDSLHRPNVDNLGQFKAFKSDSTSVVGSRDDNNNPYPVPPSATDGCSFEAYDPDKIIRVDKEKGIESIDRLGQITVTYQLSGSSQGEVIYITGAKGAD